MCQLGRVCVHGCSSLGWSVGWNLAHAKPGAPMLGSDSSCWPRAGTFYLPSYIKGSSSWCAGLERELLGVGA